MGAGLMVLGLSLAPVVTTATAVHAQFADGEGGDGGDVNGGDGGAGDSGFLPVGSQNNAAPDEQACFADDFECLALVGDEEEALDWDEWDWDWEDEEG